MSDKRSIRIKSELFNADGTLAADQTTNYYNLDPKEVLFIERHVVAEPFINIIEAAEVAIDNSEEDA